MFHPLMMIEVYVYYKSLGDFALLVAYNIMMHCNHEKSQYHTKTMGQKSKLELHYPISYQGLQSRDKI